tara:strand:+ start:1075 stop:2598 length:1524 start_codon:yes stop_codon:yes gene_type:complete
MPTEDYNLYTHFQRQFLAHADEELLCTGDGQSYSYSDIERKSAQVANFLSELGTSPGDRITVQVEKSPWSLCVYLACLRAGFVFHPLNMAYTESELQYFLDNAEPSVIICDPKHKETIKNIAGLSLAQKVFTLDGTGGGDFIEYVNTAADAFTAVKRGMNDLAALLYSSGTTGVPKGIMLTHKNLLRNTEALVEAWGFSSNDRLLHALPIFHVHGLFVAIGCVLLSGASMRWLNNYNAEEVLRFLPESTVMMGVPTYYTRLLATNKIDTEITRNVRVFISGSAPLLEETFLEFEKRTGHRILERYGMTETNMNTSNPLDGMRKPGTVGPPLPGIEVRITDDEGTVVPTGTIGNLQVKGPNVFIGYWKMADKTTDDFTADGFFNTGDKGLIDDDGYVSIVGRAKDVVITGGLNVYPKEIELFIDDLPDVIESAVIGVPENDLGEGVVAITVPKSMGSSSEKSIIIACKQHLANFKIPKRVIFVDELPRNTMGKVQKNKLRNTYQNLLK